MDDANRRIKLGRFLRSCRERTSPKGFDLHSNSRRRTPGLRREELAALAGISTAYYTKIEQGRVDVSPHVLNALAGLLSLTHTEREYAFALATDYVAADSEQPSEKMNPMLDLLLSALEPYPAQVLNHRWDFIGWNEASSAVLGDLRELPQEARNLVAMMFLFPLMREMIGDWESNARRMLAEFRADFGRYHHDPLFAKLVAFLRANGPEFDDWWTTLPDIGGMGNSDKLIYHPLVGELQLQETVLDVHDHPGLRLIMFLPQDDANRQKLQFLLDDFRAPHSLETSDILMI